MTDIPLVLMVGTRKLGSNHHEEYRWVVLSPEEVRERKQGNLFIRKGAYIRLNLLRELLGDMPVCPDFQSAIKSMDAKLPSIYEYHVEHIPNLNFPDY